MAHVEEKLEEIGENGGYWWHKPYEVKCSHPQPKPGDVCPCCSAGHLAFDGLFILSCDHCHHVADSGGFT
jgi:hypothetical protein